MAGKYDFTIEQGATYRDSFTWRVDDGSSPPTGPIVDLAGCTARMHVRTTISAPDPPLLSLTTAVNGGITLTAGAASPNIQWVITDAQTSALNFTSAVYDLELILSNGDVKRLLKGTVTLDKEVTR